MRVLPVKYAEWRTRFEEEQVHRGADHCSALSTSTRGIEIGESTPILTFPRRGGRDWFTFPRRVGELEWVDSSTYSILAQEDRL